MKPWQRVRPGSVPDVLTAEQWQRLPERPRPGAIVGGKADGGVRHRPLSQAQADFERNPPYIVLRYAATDTDTGPAVRILDVTGPFLSASVARTWATDAENRVAGGFSVLPVTVPAWRELVAQMGGS